MTADENPMGRAVARALADEAFKQELIADPRAVLAAAGVTVPDGVTLKVVENTAEVRHLVLPAAGVGELADSELAAVVGGWTCSVGDGVCGYSDYGSFFG